MALPRFMACLVLMATAPLATHARALRGGAASPGISPGQSLLQTAFDYSIQTGSSGFSSCLDVPGGQAISGVQIQHYPCNGAPGQTFSVEDRGNGWHLVRSTLDYTKCLAVAGYSAGAPIVLADCTGADNQLFGFVQESDDLDFWSMPRFAPDMCVEAPGGLLQLVSCDSQPVLRLASAGTAARRSLQQASRAAMEAAIEVGTGICLEVANGQALDGQAFDTAPIQQAPCYGSPSQTFSIEDRGDGWHLVRSALHSKSSKCLEVTGFNTVEGAPIVLADCTGLDNQLFGYTILSDEHGIFTAMPKHAPNMCVQAPSGSLELVSCDNMPFMRLASAGQQMPAFQSAIAIGASGFTSCLEVPTVQAFSGLMKSSCNGASSQMFSVESHGDGWHMVRSVVGGQCLDVAGSSTSPGARINLAGCTGADNQLFSAMEVTEDGAVIVTVKHAPGMCINGRRLASCDSRPTMRLTSM